MRIKSIFWYSVTLIISMLLAPIPSCAESVSLPENTDNNNTNTDTTSYISDVTTYTEYTPTEDTSFTMDTEITSSTLESVTETTTITTLETTTSDTTTYQDTTPETTTLDTTTLDTAPYIEENISVVTPSNEVHNTTLSEMVSTSNRESVASVSSIRATVLTVSNTNIKKTDESPETKHTAVLIPILLLMAGALFTGATSKPKN